MGALSAGNYALATIQNGMADFVESYSAVTGNTSETTIKNLFLWFSIQQGGYTMYAFAHALFLALMGAYDANMILSYIKDVDEANGDVNAMTSN